MQKLITTAALLLAVAAPAGAALTREESQYIVTSIRDRYVPMGLTAQEIVVLIRDLGNQWISYRTNPDGTVTFFYERRNAAGDIVETGPVYTVRISATSALAAANR